MAAMAQCPMPVPLSPPPYEEAIRTTGPDVSITMDTEGNDEPPPSYSEATKDDVHPTEGAEQLNTSDLMELIFPVQPSREHPRPGRRSRHHSSSRRQADRESEVDTRGLQSQSGHRKKLSVCLLSAGMGVFLVAGLIAASILRHKPNMSSHKTSDLKHFKTVTISPINKDWHKQILMDNDYGQSHMGIYKDLEKIRNRQILFDALRKSLQEAHSDGRFKLSRDPINKLNKDKSTVDPFYEEIRRISEDSSVPTVLPKTDSRDSIDE